MILVSTKTPVTESSYYLRNFESGEVLATGLESKYNAIAAASAMYANIEPYKFNTSHLIEVVDSEGNTVVVVDYDEDLVVDASQYVLIR